MDRRTNRILPGARMVWKAFGIEDDLAFLQGGDMHFICCRRVSIRKMEAFIDKFLLGKTYVDTFVTKADIF